MKSLLHTTAFSLLFFLPVSANGLSDEDQKILSARISDYAAQYKMQGIAAAVIQGDQLLWSDGVGTANPATKLRMTTDTPHLIASISKTVTAAVVMKLAEQGSLKLDKNISDYLGFPVVNPKHPAVAITCRQLLAHEGSISDAAVFSLPLDQLYTFGADHKESLKSFCRSLLDAKGSRYAPSSFSSTKPGTAHEYSNLGIALAGLVAEKAAGVPFDELSKRLIFRPLGMKNTSWRLSEQKRGFLAMPLTNGGTAYGHYTFPDYPNGGLHTSVNDLSRYLGAVINGGSLGGQQIFQSATVREMLTARRRLPADQAPTTGYALGWNHLQFDGIHPAMIGHAGGEQGVNTLMAFNPSTRTGAIVFLHKDFADRGPQVESLGPLISDLILTAENLQPLAKEGKIRISKQIAAVEKLLTTEKKRGFTGQVHVSLKGRPLLNKGYGDANYARETPVTARTRFAIGSITKTFTSTAIAILADRGQIDIDSAMISYLPGQPSEWPAAWQAITVRQLLLHRSGLGDFIQQGAELGIDPSKPVQPQRVVDLIRTIPLEHPPGAAFTYSNSGMYLLGRIIANVSGISYEKFIKRNILEPLGMDDTGFDFAAPHAIGYEGTRGKKPEIATKFDNAITYSAGALHSTAADLAIWAKAQRPAQFLSPAAWGIVEASAIEVGGGNSKDIIWFKAALAGRPYFWHDGSVDGFQAMTLHFPGEELTITVLQNHTLIRDQALASDPVKLALTVAGIMNP